MELRRFHSADAPACAALFHRAVHEGAAEHYSPAQRAAWAPYATPPREALDRLAARLSEELTWVAEEEGALEGFMSLRIDGYLDMAFVAPERRRTGLAGQLYDKIEAEARALGLIRLTTEASHLARPFFLKRGWQVDAAQQVERQSVLIPNFRMSKALS
ncbi:GNAT family N-acetyltransferase [Acidimangrovimonas pyrenivorans]|uniref:GNAT family N-acetyltransferase n=1 Tax=Acidimangrovimonas pyrenivorans TaxID=2030798 RepID=A0ABV7AHE0_9RHOB